MDTKELLENARHCRKVADNSVKELEAILAEELEAQLDDLKAIAEPLDSVQMICGSACGGALDLSRNSDDPDDVYLRITQNGNSAFLAVSLKTLILNLRRLQYTWGQKNG